MYKSPENSSHIASMMPILRNQNTNTCVYRFPLQYLHLKIFSHDTVTIEISIFLSFHNFDLHEWLDDSRTKSYKL